MFTYEIVQLRSSNEPATTSTRTTMRLVAARRLGRIELHFIPFSVVLLLLTAAAVDGVPLRIANDGVDSVVLAPIGRETIIIDTASNFHGQSATSSPARWLYWWGERYSSALPCCGCLRRPSPPPLRPLGHQQLDLGRACVSWSPWAVDGCRTRKRNRCFEGWIGSAGFRAFLKAHQLRRFRQKTNAAAVVTCAPPLIRHSRGRPATISAWLVIELCTGSLKNCFTPGVTSEQRRSRRAGGREGKCIAFRHFLLQFSA